MPDETGLEDAYRRLLRTYPRFYRRHRGLEIVTTMLDAAKPGQARPTCGEAIHLILSGMKVRLVPPGWAGKIAAGVVTLWVAVVLGGAGAYAAWTSDPAGPPDPSILDSMVTVASGTTNPGEPLSDLEVAYEYKRWGELTWYGQAGWTGQRPDPAGQWRLYETGASAQEMDLVHQRLRDQGWRTGMVVRPSTCVCTVFWASRDDVLLRVTGGYAVPEQTAIFVGAHRAEPGGVFGAATAGFVIGLVLAWPMTTWLAHRFARTPRGDRILALLFGLPLLGACVANTMDSMLSMVPDPDTASVLLAADLMYPLANQTANPLAATVIILSLAASVALTEFAPWQRHRPAGRGKVRGGGAGTPVRRYDNRISAPIWPTRSAIFSDGDRAYDHYAMRTMQRTCGSTH